MLGYLAVFIFLLFGALFVVVNLVLSSLIRPTVIQESKYTPYECGEESEGYLGKQFNPRFYIVALIFILFEIEILFMFPWGVLFKRLGWFGFWEMMVFIAILLVGFAYAWAKGDLDWIKSAQSGIID